MTLIYCKNDNNIIPLKSQNNGIFWNKISYARSQGRVFSFIPGMTFLSNTITDRGLGSVFNNVSGKKVLIYSITINLRGRSNLQTGECTISIETITSDPSSGTTASSSQYSNLKLDGNSPTSSLKFSIVDTAYTTSKVLYKENIIFSSSTSDIDSIISVNLYDEMIEIPYNQGILLRYQSSNITDSVTIYMNSIVRFIEVDDTIDF